MVRLITADETGLLKRVSIERELAIRWGIQTRNNEVVKMCWSGAGDTIKEQESTISTINKRGVVQTWNTSMQSLVHETTGLTGQAVNLDLLRTSSDEYDMHFISCNTDGEVTLFPRGIESVASDATNAEVSMTKFNVGNNTASFRLHHNTLQAANGGNERMLRVWDIARPENALFTARNVPHDKLDMRIKYWISDLQFMNPDDPSKIATCTRYSHIRLYDTRAQKRPVISISHGEWPFMRLIRGKDEHTVYAGDTTGEVYRFDLRTQQLAGAYKGHAGSIRGLALHPTLNLIASVGLGRHLLIHDTDTRKLVKRVYLKQRLNGVLFSSEGKRKLRRKGIALNSESITMKAALRHRASKKVEEEKENTDTQTDEKPSAWTTGQAAAAFSNTVLASKDSKNAAGLQAEMENYSSESDDDLDDEYDREHGKSASEVAEDDAIWAELDRRAKNKSHDRKKKSNHQIGSNNEEDNDDDLNDIDISSDEDDELEESKAAKQVFGDVESDDDNDSLLGSDDDQAIQSSSENSDSDSLDDLDELHSSEDDEDDEDDDDDDEEEVQMKSKHRRSLTKSQSAEVQRGSMSAQQKRFAEAWAQDSEDESDPLLDTDDASMFVDSRKAQHQLKKATAEARRQAAKEKARKQATANQKQPVKKHKKRMRFV